VIVDINSGPMLSRYAEIDAWCRQNGVKPGKNDLWIAACTSVDRDFDPLDGRFLKRVFFR
jgi:hypothetical protein